MEKEKLGGTNFQKRQTASEALKKRLQAAPALRDAQRESLRNPPKTAQEFLAGLESQGLSRDTDWVTQFIDLI